MTERIDVGRKVPLKDRRILVTGGSVGIGRALVEAFHEDGAKVATCSRQADGLAQLREKGVLAVAADVSRPEDVDRLMTAIRAEWEGLDALVNNAAVLLTGRLVDQPLDEWRQTLETNLTGAYLASRAAVTLMKRGSIVNVTSGLGRFAMEPYNAYCVSKAGLDMLTRALAQELSGRVRVNAVDPGTVRTRMGQSGSPPSAVVPVVRALVASNDGPTGRCFKKDGSPAWPAD